MAILDADFATTDLNSVEEDGGIRSTPTTRLEHEPRDWQSLYEQAHARAECERGRADAAEARCEELRWAEVAARTDAGSWKSRFKSCRRRLSEAEEETKELRRSVKKMPSLQAEVTYLRKLVWQAAGPSEDDRVVLLRDEVARLHKVLAERETTEDTAWAHSGEACPAAQTSPLEARQLKATIRSLRTENKRLGEQLAGWRKTVGEFQKKVDGEKERAGTITATAKQLCRENLRLNRELRYLRDVEARAQSLSDEVCGQRHALKSSKGREEKLRARLAKLRAVGATLSKLPVDEAAQLRIVLKRSRRQKTMIKRLCKENTRLRKAVKAVRAGRQAAEARVAGLRTARKTLSTSLSGMDAELRRSLRRSRRQKATIKSLSRENARLHRSAKGSRGRVETLEAQLAKLRASGSVMSKRLYGRKSEQQKKPGTGRKRGQQPGAPGHGRTQRPRLEERPEDITPPPEECVCARVVSHVV